MSNLRLPRLGGTGTDRPVTALTRVLVSLVGVLVIFATIGMGVAGAGTATISSDLADYNPGQQVTLTGAGWADGEAVHIVVNDTIGQTWQHSADVTAAGDGSFTDVFSLPPYFVSDYDATATGPLSGTATTTFTDANPSADLDQCANDSAPSPSTDGCDTNANQWVNGNLGPSKASYVEGDSIPYRMKFDNLAIGAHNVTIEWDTTKSGKHAIDYLTSFNRSVTSANPCLGVTGCSPSTFSTWPIPKDPQVDNGSGSPITQVAGVFTLFGGTITGVSAYSYPDGAGFTGDKSARITISFSRSSSEVNNPVLA